MSGRPSGGRVRDRGQYSISLRSSDVGRDWPVQPGRLGTRVPSKESSIPGTQEPGRGPTEVPSRPGPYQSYRPCRRRRVHRRRGCDPRGTVPTPTSPINIDRWSDPRYGRIGRPGPTRLVGLSDSVTLCLDNVARIGPLPLHPPHPRPAGVPSRVFTSSEGPLRRKSLRLRPVEGHPVGV